MMRDGQLFRVIDENCWSPEARIKEMDETGWITGSRDVKINTVLFQEWTYKFCQQSP